MSQNKRFYFTFVATFILAVVLIYLRGHSVFSDMSDGFTSQIALFLATPIRAWEPLSLVHLIRFIIVYPLYLAKLYAPPLESLLILLYALPLFTKDLTTHKYRYAFLLIFFMPIFISYRAFISTCGMGYLYLYLFRAPKSKWYYIASIIMAQLSSSIVLMVAIFLAAQYLYKKYARISKTYLLVSLVFLSTSLCISIAKKIPFFNQIGMTTTPIENPTNPEDYAINSNTIMQALMRNTLSDSYVKKQPSRSVFYTALLFLVGFIIFDSYKRKNYWAICFFLPTLIAFMFEGLGPLSMLITYFFYFAISPNNSTDNVPQAA